MHPTLPERVLRVAQGLLEEGLLETRMRAKRVIAQLMALLGEHGAPHAFEALAARVSGDSPTHQREQV